MNSRLTSRGAPQAVLSAVLSAGVLALALSGCGDDPPKDSDGPSGSGGSPSTSATPTVSTSESASPSATESASESAPTVAPASGPPMRIEGVALNLPAGWEISVPGDRSEGGYDPGGSGGTATIVGGLADPSESIEFNAAAALQRAKRDGLKAQRLDNRTVGGVEGWVVTGTSKLMPLQYQFGTVTGGRSVTIALRWISPPPADVQTIIDSILATVTYPATAS